MKNKIKVLRVIHGITQDDLAKALEVSRQTVQAIENDKYLPTLTLGFKIARFFGKTIEEVFQPEDKTTDK